MSLMTFFALAWRTLITTAETFYFPSGIGCGSATWFLRAPDVPEFVFRAISHPALNIRKLIFHCPTTCIGTIYLPKPIGFALTFSTHYISVKIINAVGICTNRHCE
ncbi:hypothetical protein GALL_190610 [mine drainage metagenome]|uniref:Uncharacterized protein n=1 Tax=mine drainage metagenome TaxID=410659 RepID=A0A1J5RSM6_9ZZZZ